MSQRQGIEYTQDERRKDRDRFLAMRSELAEPLTPRQGTVVETRPVGPPLRRFANDVDGLSAGHSLAHQAVVLAARDGRLLGCPECGKSATELGDVDTREAGAILSAMMQQQTEFEGWEPEPIIRNRNLYPSIPEAWEQWTFRELIRDAHNRSVIDSAESWAWAPGGTLTLEGGTGVGKTTILAAVANELLSGGADISPWTWGAWSDTVRAAYRQHVEDEAVDALTRRMQRCAVLLIDDISAERTDRNVTNLFESVIDARWSARLATVVTTNAGPEQWRDWSARAASRLQDKRSGMWLSLRGPDRRLA